LQHGLVVHENEQAREVRQADDRLAVLAAKTVEVGRAHLLLELVHARELIEPADHPALVPALAVVVGAVHHVDGVAAAGPRPHRVVEPADDSAGDYERDGRLHVTASLSTGPRTGRPPVAFWPTATILNESLMPESAYAWARLFGALLLSAIGGVGMWSVIVVLPAVQAEFGVARSAASLPYTATMISFGFGGILMGRLSDRFGIMFPVAGGAIVLGLGYAISSQATSLWQFILA